MKLELGGGVKPRGEGFVNLDKLDVADIQHDITDYPWPIEDDLVTEVYSSHCIEHIPDPMKMLREIARVGVLGCRVEIRCPHPISDLAMVWDHRHTFSPIAAWNADQYFPHEHWFGPKRLKLQHIEYRPSILLGEARRELPFLRGLSDEVVMKWIPRTCHECCFHYVVVGNEHYAFPETPTT